MPYKDLEARRKYAREYVARRRAEWLADKCCVQCGSTDRLEVDHIDPVLKVSHRVWTWAPARRDAELAKCQVLCHDHHVAKGGRGQPGATNTGAKLTAEQVEWAREQCLVRTQISVARDLGISKAQISRIANHLTW